MGIELAAAGRESAVDEKKLYTIGKISAIMGISVQTLRFYEKIGLFEPCYVNPETGYRYYEYAQMHKIDRIRYFQKLGISLKDIKGIYNGDSTKAILDDLTAQREKELRALEESKKKLEELDWYIDYFSFLQGKKHFGLVYAKHIEKRYAMLVEMGDVPFSVSNERFYHLRCQQPYADLECRRQYVSLLDDECLHQNKTFTLQYGLYLKEDPGLRNEHLVELPAGEYLCFLAPIYNEERWDTSIFEKFLDKNRSYLVIANEYEDNLYRYDQCMYEVQIIER